VIDRSVDGLTGSRDLKFSKLTRSLEYTGRRRAAAGVEAALRACCSGEGSDGEGGGG
jgi:hypothetical protein